MEVVLVVVVDVELVIVMMALVGVTGGCGSYGGSSDDD